MRKALEQGRGFAVPLLLITVMLAIGLAFASTAVATPNGPVTASENGAVPATVVLPTGFDWVDAGIGAFSALGAMLLVLGGAFLLLRRRDRRALANPVTRALPLVAVLLVVGVGAASAAPSTPRSHADSVGTLPVNITLFEKFELAVCAAGTAETTACFQQAPLRTDVFSGLGETSFAPYILTWENYRAPCGHAFAQIPLLVVGKGEIDLAWAVTGCWTGGNFPTMPVTVTGGSGLYAGATGSGVLEFHPFNDTGPGTGTRQVTWTGTLNVPGLAFDTTAPQINGGVSKTVTTRLKAGARVSYSVTATDATDAAVHAVCLPKSGSLFPLGRTTVVCNAGDKSGNTAPAKTFVINVKRVK